MDNDEFNDLEKFGKVIEKPPEKNTVKEKKKEVVSSKKYSKKIALKILKVLFYFAKRLSLKLKELLSKTLVFFKTKKEIKKRYKAAVKRHRKHKDISYKIVETKKQRGNKTVIVRRRVPSYFDTSSLVAKPNNAMGNIYYLSLNEESEQENTRIKHGSYTVLKKSVWDFPVEDKSIFRRAFYTLRIRGLFKK